MTLAERSGRREVTSRLRQHQQMMEEACPLSHNAHADHLRLDWQIGMVMTAGDPLSGGVAHQFPHACKLVDFMSDIFTLFSRHSVVVRDH